MRFGLPHQNGCMRFMGATADAWCWEWAAWSTTKAGIPDRRDGKCRRRAAFRWRWTVEAQTGAARTPERYRVAGGIFGRAGVAPNHPLLLWMRGLRTGVGSSQRGIRNSAAGGYGRRPAGDTALDSGVPFVSPGSLTGITVSRRKSGSWPVRSAVCWMTLDLYAGVPGESPAGAAGWRTSQPSGERSTKA
jgi:hypothetical protein